MVPILKTVSEQDRGMRKISPLSSGPLRSVVLDFDGTLTDVAKEAEGYENRFMEGLAKAVGMRPAELSEIWKSVRDRIMEDPFSYGWEMDGKVVAPAASDPHILASVIASKSLDSLGLLKDPPARAATLDFLFHANYRLNRIFFKEGAADFLGALMERTGVSIVTSSRASSVLDKLSTLSLPALPPVYGEARKNVLDPAWTAVPESMDAGFGRPVYLRRRFYWDILEKVTSGIEPAGVLVAGDIYELDLSLPQFMGMRAALLPKQSASPQEISAVSARGNGFVSASLGDCLAAIAALL